MPYEAEVTSSNPPIFPYPCVDMSKKKKKKKKKKKERETEIKETMENGENTLNGWFFFFFLRDLNG
jgi:hypothetical protein